MDRCALEFIARRWLRATLTGELRRCAWRLRICSKFKLTVRETMAKYLDANNFYGGNPAAVGLLFECY